MSLIKVLAVSATAVAYAIAVPQGTVASIPKGRPMMITFINRDCPHSWVAAPFFKRLAEAYGSGSMLGVINCNSKGYADYQKKFMPPFAALFDPHLKIIRSYKVETAPTTLLIDAKGKVVRRWAGVSDKYYLEISAEMSKITNTPYKALPTDGLPTYPQAGCSFGP
ncbi:MAG: TlpA family protein disulfide reductase [Fimbriimonas sp.]